LPPAIVSTSTMPVAPNGLPLASRSKLSSVSIHGDPVVSVPNMPEKLAP
jgi:hypothetical protein